MKTTTPIIRGIILSLLFLYPVVATGTEDAKPYAPRITGLLKTRLEIDTHGGDVRFNVNNARLGIGGLNATPNGTFRYQFQAELNAQGKFTILDTYAAYSIGAFEISAGQQQYRFGTELNRGPRLNYFADASYLACYIGSYCYTSPETGRIAIGNLGARDIGILGKYCSKTGIPFNAIAGFVNGTGINNPVWRKSLNFVARLWIDPNANMCGFGTAVNFYSGRTPYGDPIYMAGGELRYVSDRWRIEAEYARRNMMQAGKAANLDLATLHAIYLQPFNKHGLVKFLAPMARWDYGHNIPLMSAESGLLHIDANRATAGLTVGFAETLLKCELRLNYEHCFLTRETTDLIADPAFHNKFIVEFFLAF